MDQQLTISLFGTPVIRVNDVAISNWPSRAAEAVIAYVALAGQPVPRTILIDLLWPESEPKQAAANLRTILTRIRREVGDAIAVDRKTVTLNAATVDVLQFAKLADLNAPIAQLIRAADLYTGAFLDGFQLRSGYPFEEWMILERERWARRYELVLERLVSHHLAIGAYREGERFAQEWVALEPLHEQATQQLMLLQLRQGRRTAALQSYSRLATVLQAELAVEPLATTQAVWTRAKRARQIGRNNLPVEPSPLIGRSSELTSLTQQLGDPNTRLVTMLGMGGIGKTRLAQAIGRKIIAEKTGMFLDGIWFVSLVAVENLAELIQAIVSSLNINVRNNRSVREQLEAYFKPRELLLILDNFEQLVNDDPAVQWISQLLRDTPNLKLLITSRAQLNLYEEQLFYLQGLPTDDAADTPAVALFLQHAARQAVQLAEGEYRPILEICRWLEGVPLGIELAASWVNQFSPAEIRATIVKDHDFLQTRYRNVPARQRSLRAVFEHSWELLSAEQQTCFAMLAYFPNSFDATAAAAIVAATLTDLRELVGKSLLQLVDGQRFNIHPLLREYGLEKLAERATLAEKHADYYLYWLAAEYPKLLETGQDEIHTDVPNVRLAWSAGAAVAAQVAAIGPTGYYWRMRGWYADGVALLQPLTSADHRLLKIRALNEVGTLYHRLGEYDKSAACYEQVRAMTAGERSAERAKALEWSNQVAMRQKSMEAAVDYITEAVAIRRELGDDARLAGALGIMVQTLSYSGQPDDALFDEAMSLPTYPLTRVNLLAQAGRTQIAAGKYAEAVVTFTECERLHRQLNYPPGVASATLNAAIAATYSKQWQIAEAQLNDALVLFEENDEKFGTGLIYLHQGMVQEEAYANFPAAYQHYLDSVRVFEAMQSGYGVGLASGFMAGAAARLGRDDALQQLQRALRQLHETDSVQLFSSQLTPVAAGLAHLGHVKTAMLLCGFSLHKGYTEAIALTRIDRIFATWPLPGIEFEDLVERGGELSAEELVELVEELTG